MTTMLNVTFRDQPCSWRTPADPPIIDAEAAVSNRVLLAAQPMGMMLAD